MKFDMVSPLLGFEGIKQVELQKIDDIFMNMRSCQDTHISFTLINPFILREYDFIVPDDAQELLEVNKDSNLLILNIVLIQTPIEDSMVNFIGPIIFNTDTKKASQIVLDDTSKYGAAQKISTFLNK